MTGVLAILIARSRSRGNPCRKPSPSNKASPAKPGPVAIIQMSPIEQAEQNGTALHISLKELTKLALQSNLDIAISDTNEPCISRRSFRIMAITTPASFWASGTGRNKSANTNITNQSSTTFNQRDSANWNFAINQYVPTGGESPHFSIRPGRTQTRQPRCSHPNSPHWPSSVHTTFMRNRRTDLTRTQH